VCVWLLLGMMFHGPAWVPSTESQSAEAEVVFAALPENIEAPEAVLNVMREMWRASQTFRRQMLRISQARQGRVVIEIRTQRSTEFQAASLIQRNGAAWRAKVGVHYDTKLVEMIAHEFEHVIEQMDSIDLVRLAKQGLDGVEPAGDHFETTRAIAAGKRVAKEFANRGKQAS
jgi:hypothetical protein